MTEQPTFEEEIEKPLVKQKLPDAVIVLFITLLSASGPIATDIFMPAIPSMPEMLNTTEPMVNMCITIFFFTQAFGMLLFGPFSDRFGRKPMLFLTLVLFIGNALLASTATDIMVILVARAFQGLGGGGSVSLATAMVKDVFSGEKRQTVLVVSHAIALLAPVCAPVLGSAILTITDWRGIFIMQAILAFICVPLTILLKEPLRAEERVTGNPLKSLKGLVTVGKNPKFLKLLFATSTGLVGSMAYVTCASYVYMDIFNTGTFGFSFFFGGNVAFSIITTLLIVPLVKRFKPSKLITAVLLPLPVFGLMIILVGPLSPWTFFVFMTLSGAMGGMLRPISTNILLGLQEGDTGSASALINFVGCMLNTLGSLAISLPWPNYIVGIGSIAIIATGLAIPLWLSIRKRVAQSGIEK